MRRAGSPCDPRQNTKGQLSEAAIFKRHGKEDARFAQVKRKQRMGVWLLLNCGSVCILDGHEVQGDIDCRCTQSWPSRVPPCLSASLQRLHIESCTRERAHPKGCWDIPRGFRWGPRGHGSLLTDSRGWCPFECQSQECWEERAAVAGKARKRLEAGSPRLVLSASDTGNGRPLSLPVMQLKWRGGVPSGKPCSHSSESPVHWALLQSAAGESGWMRPERPMVWCCFFLRAQVSSLLFLSWGWVLSTLTHAFPGCRTQRCGRVLWSFHDPSCYAVSCYQKVKQQQKEHRPWTMEPGS